MSQPLRGLAAVALLLVLGLVSPGCNREPGPSPDQARPATTQAPPATGEANAQAAAANDLGLRLYPQLQRDAKTPNVFLSPLSIHLALAMTYNGAAGKTAEAMAKTLGLAGKSLAEVSAAAKSLLAQLAGDKGAKLLLADSLWCDPRVTFLPAFLEVNKANYAAEVRNTDFRDAQKAADLINGWTKDKTQGKIPQIVEARDLTQAALVLVNALYFKGTWDKPFEKGQTQPGPFHLAGGKTKTLPMMQRWGKMEYRETESYQAVRLPYQGATTRMIVFLPKPGKTPAEVLGTLTAKAWPALMAEQWKGDGHLALPRFKADYAHSLAPALTALGMGVAFDQSQADFSKMADLKTAGGAIWISDVLHKCVLEVNEEGTVGAAATAVPMEMKTAAAPAEKQFEMVVDRPFVLAIEQIGTGSLLFVGAIGEPG